MLKCYGYNTSAFGKWHNTPEEQITSKGPFDYWPTGYGFEYFYGFLAGEASQYEPTLVRNTSYVKHPHTSGGNDHYHLSEDIADDAIHWLREQKAYAPEKPWFIYWAPGASHGPHHVMKEWADKYKGTFDDGWDAYRERVFANQKKLGWIPPHTQLTPRAESMASWESIPVSERPFQCRLMEIFAGFTEHADFQAGRLIAEIESQGELDNTLMQIVNGFSQDTFDGVSMVYTFDAPQAKGQKTTQFFDIMASRGIYQNGWFASARGPREPWVGGIPKGIREWSPLTDQWQLYNLDQDWSQANDLAEKLPEKLEAMKALFLTESAKNKNLPIGGGLWSTALYHPEDAPASSLTEWTFDYPIIGMPESAAPKLGKVDSLVTMEVDVPENANGVLYALAGFSGGVACFVQDGYLCYEFNLFEIRRTKLKAKAKLPTGKVTIEVESRLAEKIGGPMDVTLKVNGVTVAKDRVPAAMSLHFTSNATFDIGTDLDSPVTLDYFDLAPFTFNGAIGKTRIEYLK